MHSSTRFVLYLSKVFPHPKWLRESELKHGRIAMLAAIGAYTAQLGLVIPGYEDALKVRA